MAVQVGLGDAQVGEFGLAVFVEEDVVGLDVAVDHAVTLGLGEGAGHLRHDAQGVGLRQGTIARQQAGHAPAGEIVHHHVAQARRGVAPHIVHRHQMGMVDAPCQPCLAQEPHHEARITRRDFRCQNLHRHRRAQDGMRRQPHAGHPPAPQFPHQTILPKDHATLRHGHPSRLGGFRLHTRSIPYRKSLRYNTCTWKVFPNMPRLPCVALQAKLAASPQTSQSRIALYLIL